MKNYFLLFVAFFLLLTNPLQGADFGFGIPSMVEGKVDELDQNVREFEESQPFLEDITESSIAVSQDTRDVVLSSTITESSLKNRIFLTLEVNRSGEGNFEEGIILFQADGEGKRIGSELMANRNDFGLPTFNQLSVSPNDQHVDLLLNVPTDSGPQAVFFRRNADNDLSPVGGFGVAGTGEIVIGTTSEGLGSPDATNVDTAVEVNTFSYDQSLEDIYLSGNSGLFKVLYLPSQGGAILPNGWNSKFQGEFHVPEDNLVVKGDTIYVTAFEPDGSGDTNIVLKKIAADSEVAQTNTIATSTSNPTTSLLGGENNLFFHYREGSGSDELFRINYEDITTIEERRPFSLSSNFRLKLEGSERLYAEGTDGDVFSFNKDSFAGSDQSLTVSDTRVTLVFQAQNDELYVGTRDSAVLAAEGDLSDTEQVFPAPGQVINQEVCQPGNTADESVFTKPVWLKRGFLGIVFSGSCIGWSDEGIDSMNLINTSWPHEDANNQRQRNPQN